MARVSTYLNFPRSTEAAFTFYKTVFNAEFSSIHRFCEVSPQPGVARMREADKNLVMHVELPILGGHVLMGSDAPASIGFPTTRGNNIQINLEPDSRTETTRLFKALAEGGRVNAPLQETFSGGYFGSVTDRFGVNWRFNCIGTPEAPGTVPSPVPPDDGHSRRSPK